MPTRYQVLTLQKVDAKLLFLTGKMSSTEKETYKIVGLSGKQKDYYCWSRLFFAYADLRKYKDVLTKVTTIPDQEDPAIKKEKHDVVKAEYADILSKSRKATPELLTVVEKSSVCFLHVSCARNTRKALLSLKERYKPTTVVGEL